MNQLSPTTANKNPQSFLTTGVTLDNCDMKKHYLRLALCSLTAVISGVQWTKVSEVVRTAIGLSNFVIYIPTHLGVFPI